MLGSLRRGDFGFLFARPETGKTTFLVSEVTNFASQLTESMGPILWFNNEEQGNKVQLRLYQAMLGCNLTELFSDIKGNQDKYMERGGAGIKLYDSAAIHRKQVEQITRELRPSLIIFDQLDKIKGFTDDREDLRLGAIYIWAREIAKQYCPVIAVCQADASGEGKRWLTMENVANAKTAKQAEADWIMGIGKTHDVSEEYMRHLHICKNKLTGDTDSDPSLRHGRQTVRILPDLARYEDLT
jgi:KaiC/GvpD/RAD55 family RecA-like ATPase